MRINTNPQISQLLFNKRSTAPQLKPIGTDTFVRSTPAFKGYDFYHGIEDEIAEFTDEYNKKLLVENVYIEKLTSPEVTYNF